MIISLLGYMGAGKSHISQLLSDILGYSLTDIDKEISRRAKMPVSEIFQRRGELYFRKMERELLEELLATLDKAVLSLGGGTPCYYNNMELINQNSVSVYLRASVSLLAGRLSRQKEKRPLISHLTDEDLPEFIAKHLFDRNSFYSRARITVDTDGKTPSEIAEEIALKIY